MYNRISNREVEAKVTTAAAAAQLIKDGMTVGMSGFSMAGYPKAVPTALARRTEKGERIKITLITGASVGDEIDGQRARAGVIARRYPYQSNKSMRDLINDNEIAYVDMQLSQVPFFIKNGYFGKINVAVIEAIGIDEQGNIIPSTSIGCSNTLVEYAEKVIVEVNMWQPVKLEGIHDVYSPRPHQADGDDPRGAAQQPRRHALHPLLARQDRRRRHHGDPRRHGFAGED